jgi:hypothetical protein
MILTAELKQLIILNKKAIKNKKEFSTSKHVCKNQTQPRITIHAKEKWFA